MAYIFVNKGFDAKINGKKRDDVTLTFNSNAFNTIQAAYSAAGINWNDVEDGDPVNKVVLLDNKCEITSGISYPANNMEILADENGKLRGTLKVTADISGGDNNIRFSKFKNVELTNAMADDFYGGVESNSKTSTKLALGGKITVGENTHVGNIVDYQTVDIWGKNTQVAEVTGNGNVVKKNKEDNPVSMQNTVTGSVTVKDNAKVLGDITGYKNVTVEKAAVLGDIKGIANDLDVAAKYDNNNVLTGYEIAKVNDEKYTSVSVADNVKWDGTSAKGTLTIKKSAKDAGTVKLEKADVDGKILDFTTVKIEKDSTVKGVERFAQISQTLTQNYKTGKDNVVTLTETVKSNRTFNGSATISDSQIIDREQNQDKYGAVIGYNKVNVTNSLTGDIKLFDGSGDNIWKTSTVKNVYEAVDANVFKAENWAENAADFKVASEENHKYSSTGSVTVKLDKNAKAAEDYFVGNITGYKSVTIAALVDKNGKVVAGVSTGNIFNKVDESYSLKDTRKVIVTGEGADAKNTYNGTLTGKYSKSAAGSLKVSNAVIGAFNGYKNVTLDNVLVNGNDVFFTPENGSEKSERKSVFTTADNGKVEAVITEKITEKAVGTLSAKNSDVMMNLVDYTNVKLTNTIVRGVINSNFNSTEEGSYLFRWSNYASYTNDQIEKSDDLPETTSTALVSSTVKSAKKAAGSVTVKLDKDLNDKLDYFCNSISGYKTVSVSGFCKDNKNKVFAVKGSIVGGDTASVTNKANSLTSRKNEYNSTGKVTLEYVKVAESVTGFANAVLKNTTVVYNVYGGNSVSAKGDADDEVKVVSQEAAGSLSMENSIVGGTVGGYKTVNVKKGFNSVEIYTGTANSKESVTIAKNAVLAVKNNLALNNEDKLTVNGELILQAGQGDNAWNSTLSKIDGKGVVYANAETLNKIKGIIANSQVEGKNLGATSKHFKGIALENTDNSAAQAAVWDEVGEFGGWLGVNTKEFNDLAFQDKEDYIRFTAEEDETVYISSNEWDNASVICDTVKLMDKDGRVIKKGEFSQYENYLGQKTWQCTFDVAAGEEYVLCITRNYANSMSYTIAFEA